MSDEQSVNYQQEAINRYAEQHGITIIKQYNDVGYSGKNSNRPELQLIFDDLHSGDIKVDYLLFYSVDRLGRDLESNIGTILKITEYVETVVSVSEQVASNAEHFKMFFLIFSSQAQTEREHLLLRMADGRKAKIINRKSFNGSYLPLGYVKRNSGDKEQLVPATEYHTDDYGAIQGLTIVQFIFYSYVEGLSLRKIAERLYSYFGLTKRQTKWSHKAVRYVLSNPAYIGRMSGVLRNNENYYIKNANIEPIVDSLMFTLIQKRLKFGHSGKEKSLASRLSLFTLCLNCAEPLVRNGGQITCRSCGRSVEAKTLLDVLGDSFTRVLERRGIEKFHKKLSELVKSYELQRKRLLYQLNILNDAYEIIPHLKDCGEHDKKVMIRENTRISTKIRKDLEYVEATIEALEDKSSTDNRRDQSSFQFPHVLLSTRLIRLSHLILIDMETNEIEILFHHDLLKGEYHNG